MNVFYHARDGYAGRSGYITGLFRLYGTRVENDGPGDGQKDPRSSTYEGTFIPFCMYLDRSSSAGPKSFIQAVNVLDPQLALIRGPNSTSMFVNSTVDARRWPEFVVSENLLESGVSGEPTLPHGEVIHMGLRENRVPGGSTASRI